MRVVDADAGRLGSTTGDIATPHRESAESDAIDERLDPKALVVTLTFSDRLGRIFRRVELDDCFSVEQLPSATINVRAMAEALASDEVDFEGIVCRLFSIVAAKTATLRVELTPDGELVFSLSFGTYESEAVISLKECGELFASVEDEEDEDEDED